LVRLRVLPFAAVFLAALLAFASWAPAATSPTAGKTVVVARVSGVVRVHLPGAAGFSALHGARVVPLKTTVDALRGVVRLTSADGSGSFYQGMFQVFEPNVAPVGAGKGRLTDLHLVGGSFKGCKRKLAGAGAGAGADAKPIRRLWGNAKGRFRTQGRFAAATVRGTRWLTADFCTGSEVTVRAGVVAVRDLVHGKTVNVPAGKKYDAELSLAPVNTAPPTIAGTPSIGQTLTASAGTWTGTPAPAFAYRWQRCDAAGANCIDVSGATGITYLVQPGDAGATLRVRVTATNAAGTASATSAATALVASGPANITPPSITGTIAPGLSLQAAVGTWSGVPAPTFAFQWLRCNFQAVCTPIAGATAIVYTIQAADVALTLRVQVTATNSAGSTNVVSAPVGPINPRITIGDVSLKEGNLGVTGGPSTTNFVFTVTLSAPSPLDVTVSYATADDTATSNPQAPFPGPDYRAASGTLTFKAGATSATITVVVIGDGTVEPDERFFVNLSSPVNAEFLDAQAIGTILNDDTPIP
jgi:hypothetical protein